MAQTVFIADDVESLRALLRAVLEETPEIEVVGEAATGADAVAGVLATSPDILLLDLSMPEMDGLEAISVLNTVAPDTKVIAVSGFRAERMADVARARGAVGYFEKGAPLEVLRDTILAQAA